MAVAREPPSEVRLGSCVPWSFEEPLVVAVAVDGKKLALLPALYEVWYILALTASPGFLIGSASCTTKLLLRWYLSGDCDCFVIRERIISPLTLSLPLAVVEAGTEGDGPDVNRPPLSAPYSIV